MPIKATYLFIAALLCSCLAVSAPDPNQARISPAVPPATRAALATITPNNLRGDLSFIASDTLQGRYTPSPGLDAAAEFIASRFRAAGLEPGGDAGFFQVAHMIDRRLPVLSSSLEITAGGKTFQISPASVSVLRADRAVSLNGVETVSVANTDPDLLNKPDITGRVVLVAAPDLRKLPQDQMMAAYRRFRSFERALTNSPAVIGVLVSASPLRSTKTQLIASSDTNQSKVPLINVVNSELLSSIGGSEHSTPFGKTSLSFPAPVDDAVTLKNVIGVLPGSDSKLKGTYVLLTAHYDHIGTSDTGRGMASPTKPNEQGDHIYNGANDDGSGTVSVIAIAEALSRLPVHPKRSLVFMTFFGEERGELGSEFYGQHPAFPLGDTVADINLEQVGRTDSTTGKQVNTASLTGYDYSDVTKYLEQAGRQTGIKLYKDPEASDAYFTRSDNDALAQRGIPAHSLTVAFDYPDYHGLSDTWDKIDYDNMARVDRMIALGLVDIADSTVPPKWNASNPKAKPFLEAQQKNRP